MLNDQMLHPKTKQNKTKQNKTKTNLGKWNPPKSKGLHLVNYQDFVKREGECK